MTKIKIENVPEVATISKLLGVDANNKWAKIPGAKFATAEQLTAVDNKATNAQTAANSAVQTADQAKSTADGIDGKATQALSNSQTAVSTAATAKTIAEKNDALLMGAETWLNEGDITIYTGNWVNGTLDPKPGTGQVNAKFRCISFEYKTPNTRTLTLKDFESFYGTKMHGRLVVVVKGGSKLNLTVPPAGNQGAVVPVNPANNPNGLALYVFSIELCETYGIVDCLYNCTFEQANPLQVLLNAERGGSVTVDSALSTDSTNPVENKAVTAALNAKAGLASPTFSGTPSAPTPATSSNSHQLATTQFVQTVVSKKAPIDSPAFTGTPTAPTPSWLEDSERIATTDFVQNRARRWDITNKNWIQEGQIFVATANTIQIQSVTMPGAVDNPIYPNNEAICNTFYVVSTGRSYVGIRLAFGNDKSFNSVTVTGLNGNVVSIIKVLVVTSPTTANIFAGLDTTMAQN